MSSIYKIPEAKESQSHKEPLTREQEGSVTVCCRISLPSDLYMTAFA